ncbi:hypothetical protein HPULCUR_012179 [Helicostylum pulchrum]|uniref:Chromo domain-containing protein n=1 Tax=Helicostylum pulchrum TaxID=562976 RepID=A0ABP9YIE9_9FUNG
MQELYERVTEVWYETIKTKECQKVIDSMPNRIEACIKAKGYWTKSRHLVRWKNYSSDWDEWLPTDHFNDVDCLRKYWKHLGTEYKPKKSNVITNAPSSSKNLQTTKPSTISKLIDTIPLEEDVVNYNPTSRSKKRKCSTVWNLSYE